MVTTHRCKFFDVTRPDELKPGRKTHTYTVVNKTRGDILGSIKWYGPWRKFCFFPSASTVWSVDCLKDISGVLGSLSERGGK